MKYEMLDGRYKVPVLTKEWKAMWFVLGMFFNTSRSSTPSSSIV